MRRILFSEASRICGRALDERLSLQFTAQVLGLKPRPEGSPDFLGSVDQPLWDVMCVKNQGVYYYDYD